MCQKRSNGCYATGRCSVDWVRPAWRGPSLRRLRAKHFRTQRNGTSGDRETDGACDRRLRPFRDLRLFHFSASENVSLAACEARAPAKPDEPSLRSTCLLRNIRYSSSGTSLVKQRARVCLFCYCALLLGKAIFSHTKWELLDTNAILPACTYRAVGAAFKRQRRMV